MTVVEQAPSRTPDQVLFSSSPKIKTPELVLPKEEILPLVNTLSMDLNKVLLRMPEFNLAFRTTSKFGINLSGLEFNVEFDRNRYHYRVGYKSDKDGRELIVSRSFSSSDHEFHESEEKVTLVVSPSEPSISFESKFSDSKTPLEYEKNTRTAVDRVRGFTLISKMLG